MTTLIQGSNRIYINSYALKIVFNSNESIPTILYALEILVLTIGLVMIYLLGRIAIVKKGVHINLLVVISSTFIFAIFYSIGRFLLLLHETGIIPVKDGELNSVLISSSMFNLFCLFYVPSTFFAVISERVCATFFLVDYEKRQRLYIPATIISTLTTLSIVASVLMTFHITHLGVLVSVVVFTTFVACLAYVWLFLYNLKLFKKIETISSSQYSLSKRFQLQENIRSFQIFKKVFPVLAILVSMIIVLEYILTTSQYTWQRAETFEILKSSLIPSVSFLLLCSYDRWREELLRLVCRRTERAKAVTQDVQESTDAYFRIFNNSWK